MAKEDNGKVTNGDIKVALAVLQTELKNINLLMTNNHRDLKDELKESIKVATFAKELAEKNDGRLDSIEEWQKDMKGWQRWLGRTVIGTAISSVIIFILALIGINR